MANWQNGSLRQGQRIRASQGGDRALSKVMELNKNYRIFFPTFIAEYDVLDDNGNVVDHVKEPDIRAAVVPGRTGVYDIIGTSFIPYKNDMYTVDPITDKFNDTTPLKDWARIAKVLYDAQCAREKKNAEAEAERAAKEMGKPIDTVTLQQKLDAIELNYHGGTAANGDKIMPKNNAALSRDIVFKVSTRVLYVPLDTTDTPDWKNAGYAVLEISKARGEELTKMLNNPKHFRGEYLECTFSYDGTDKKEAGKNAKFGPVTKSDSLEESFPDTWRSNGESMVRKIVVGDNVDDQIAFLRSRNRAFSGTHTPADIISAYRKWCSTNQAVFGSIDFTSENVARSATLFLENHLVDSMPKQLAEFQRLVEEGKEDSAASAEDTPARETTSAEPTLAQMASGEAQADNAAVATALNMFASGDAANQTLRAAVEKAPDINISSGDDELGDL